MYTSGKLIGKFNSCLAKRVIELHSKGYDCDFALINNSLLLCVQANMHFMVSMVEIKVIDQQYDHLTCSYKYVHTISTDSGEKGMLVTGQIVTNNHRI